VASCIDLQAAVDLHDDVKTVRNFHPLVFLLTATILEVSGDALVRIAIYERIGLGRIMLALAGSALLFGYGLTVNLAPLEFGQLAGLYIATLFIVWQIINLVVFRTIPSLPIVVGGTLIVAGGLIVTFWQPNVSL
jgi:small multidrug resistance family-3 protein